MSDQNNAKLKALKLTLDKLDKTYGKGAVMKLGDEAAEEVLRGSLSFGDGRSPTSSNSFTN